MALQQPQKTASQMLAKLSQEGKYTFQLNESRTAYCLVDHLGVVFGCVANKTQMSQTAAMVFLGDLQEQFYCQFSTQEVQSCTENTTQFRRFSVTMKKATEIAYAGGQEKINAVKKQIEDTRLVMADNIDKVLERGERLDDVMDKSEAMKDTANTFRQKGKGLRRKMWWQNMKMKLIIAAVVIVLILLLFFGICRGVSCVTK
jgi:vesicle-associated membrane protein 72